LGQHALNTQASLSVSLPLLRRANAQKNLSATASPAAVSIAAATLPPVMIIYQDHSGGQANVDTRGGFMITITLNNSRQRLIAQLQRDARARHDAWMGSHGRGNQRTIGHFDKQEILLIDELIGMNKRFPAERLERLPNDKIACESDIRDAAIARETTLRMRKFERKKGDEKFDQKG
jgi:hypothetical protein